MALDDAPASGFEPVLRPLRAIRRVAGVALGKLPPNDPSERRYARVARATASSGGVRLIGIFVSLVTVPLTIGYLGPERYGAWMTIGSVLAWLSLADVGVANHLMNALSSAFGRNDEPAARRAVSTAFIVLTGVAAAIASVGIPVAAHLSWSTLLNVRTPAASAELRSAIIVALVLFCLDLPLLVIERIYLALQRGATANAWRAAGVLATLAAILVATRTRGGLVALVAATAGTAWAVRVINASWLFYREIPHIRPRLSDIRGRESFTFVSNSAGFFMVQLTALVLYSTDNIIISTSLGAAAVPPYSVTWRLFALSNVLVTFSFPYLWSAYGEALTKGDTSWVRRTFRRSITWGTVAALVALLPLVAFSRVIIAWWAGPVAVPNWPLVFWMGAWNLILAPATCIACFLNATGKTRIQAMTGFVSAPANVLLSIGLARHFGTAGVIAATVITYSTLVLLPASVVAKRTLQEVCALESSSNNE